MRKTCSIPPIANAFEYRTMKPSQLWKVLSLVGEYVQDLTQFVRFNGYSPFVPYQKRLAYRLLIEAHTVEKGLALPAPRPLFGRDKIEYLLGALDQYDLNESYLPAQMALGALEAYKAFNERLGAASPLLGRIQTALDNAKFAGLERRGGTRIAPPSGPAAGGEELLRMRASCRNFSSEPLSLEEVNSIVGLAQNAPSQCNRQSARAHFYQDDAKIQELLSLQRGARGFAERVRNLFVVTSELPAWGGPGQRQQLYVDGALFSMYLMLAAQSRGVASCPLNLALTSREERVLRRAANIPAFERVIMMVAVGRPAVAPLHVAHSPRRSVAEVLTLHGAFQTASPAGVKVAMEPVSDG